MGRRRRLESSSRRGRGRLTPRPSKSPVSRRRNDSEGGRRGCLASSSPPTRTRSCAPAVAAREPALGGCGACAERRPDLAPGVAVVEQDVDEFVLGRGQLLDRDRYQGERVEGVSRRSSLCDGSEGDSDLVAEPAQLESRDRYRVVRPDRYRSGRGRRMCGCGWSWRSSSGRGRPDSPDASCVRACHRAWSVLLCRFGMTFDCARLGGGPDLDLLRRQRRLADLADPDLEQALVIRGVNGLGGHALGQRELTAE